MGIEKKTKQDNKEKEAFVDIAGDVIKDALILTLDEKLKSWVLDSNASFHVILNKECLKNYVQ